MIVRAAQVVIWMTHAYLWSDFAFGWIGALYYPYYGSVFCC